MRDRDAVKVTHGKGHYLSRKQCRCLAVQTSLDGEVNALESGCEGHELE